MTQPIPITPPTSTESTKAHSNSDVDSSVTSQHHTLGVQHNQASPGDHTHNGKSSKKIGARLDPAFPLVATVGYTQAQMQQVIDALRDIGFGS